MKIETEDGRVFEGTPDQIVHAMRTASFHSATTDEDYMHWAAQTAEQAFGATMTITGDDDAARAASFVAEMVRVGLVYDITKGPHECSAMKPKTGIKCKLPAHHGGTQHKGVDGLGGDATWPTGPTGKNS